MIDAEVVKKLAKEAWPDLPEHWWERQDGAVASSVSQFANAIAAHQRDIDAGIADSFYHHIRQYTTDVPNIGDAIRNQGAKK